MLMHASTNGINLRRSLLDPKHDNETEPISTKDAFSLRRRNNMNAFQCFECSNIYKLKHDYEKHVQIGHHKKDLKVKSK